MDESTSPERALRELLGDPRPGTAVFVDPGLRRVVVDPSAAPDGWHRLAPVELTRIVGHLRGAVEPLGGDPTEDDLRWALRFFLDTGQTLTADLVDRRPLSEAHRGVVWLALSLAQTGREVVTKPDGQSLRVTDPRGVELVVYLGGDGELRVMGRGADGHEYEDPSILVDEDRRYAPDFEPDVDRSLWDAWTLFERMRGESAPEGWVALLSTGELDLQLRRSKPSRRTAMAETHFDVSLTITGLQMTADIRSVWFAGDVELLAQALAGLADPARPERVFDVDCGRAASLRFTVDPEESDEESAGVEVWATASGDDPQTAMIVRLHAARGVFADAARLARALQS